jgi:hypothetical protein
MKQLNSNNLLEKKEKLSAELVSLMERKCDEEHKTMKKMREIKDDGNKRIETAKSEWKQGMTSKRMAF